MSPNLKRSMQMSCLVALRGPLLPNNDSGITSWHFVMLASSQVSWNRGNWNWGEVQQLLHHVCWNDTSCLCISPPRFERHPSIGNSNMHMKGTEWFTPTSFHKEIISHMSPPLKQGAENCSAWGWNNYPQWRGARVMSMGSRMGVRPRQNPWVQIPAVE